MRHRAPSRAAAWIFVVALLAGARTGFAGEALVPSGLAWGPGGRLCVALRDAQRIDLYQAGAWKKVGEWPLPVRPVSIATAADASMVAVGGMDGELVILDSEGRVESNRTIGRGPGRVVCLAGGRVAFATRWDLTVRILERGGRVLSEHRLPFAPGAMAECPGGRIAVADAFGGHLALLDPARPADDRTSRFDGVALRGLACSSDGRELLVVHMEQRDPVPITTATIDSGQVLSSRLSGVRLDDLRVLRDGDEPVDSRTIALDGPVHGAADPSALAVSADGNQVIIALAGSHQVLRSDRRRGAPSAEAPDLPSLGHNQALELLEVGRNPVALVIDPSGAFAVTADASSDTLSVVDLGNFSLTKQVRLARGATTRSSVQRGEVIFHDGRRSHDRWMSCASCHVGGHTTGLNFDTRGDGGFGAPKNTPSLLGVRGTEPFTWTGEFASLGDQVHQSLLTSLRGADPEGVIVDDLTAYLESLGPPPPRRSDDEAAVKRGATLFQLRRCDACHREPLYTSATVRDVGLDDGAGGHRRFNPPSLRGVAWSAPYFHDGRAATLDDVLSSHPPAAGPKLLDGERDDLAAFLRSL